MDGVKRLCHIRGKMRKKVWVNVGDIVLLGLREYQVWRLPAPTCAFLVLYARGGACGLPAACAMNTGCIGVGCNPASAIDHHGLSREAYGGLLRASAAAGAQACAIMTFALLIAALKETSRR